MSTDEPNKMTHKQAVRRMARWLRNSMGYSVVVAELATSAMETPDVLGFHSSRSMLIEVKVSRADFLADGEKSFRRRMEQGMGDERYFAAPKGMLNPEEMPDKWGLIEIDERCVRVVKEAEQQESNKRNEVIFLVSAIRRLEIATAVFVRTENEAEEAA